MRALLGLARNPYDRFGHLLQGLLPALATRELLLRTTPLPRGRWLTFLCACVGFSTGALFEVLEWLAALARGGDPEAFTGTQGDPWDTQWDLLLALVGAGLGPLLLGRLHDRELGLTAPEAPGPQGGATPRRS